MKRRIFSILFALVLVCSFSLVTAVPMAASPGDPPTIDGLIDEGEWDEYFLETYVSTGWPAHVIDLYLTFDSEYIYVAYEIDPASESWSQAYASGLHPNVYIWNGKAEYGVDPEDPKITKNYIILQMSTTEWGYGRDGYEGGSWIAIQGGLPDVENDIDVGYIYGENGDPGRPSPVFEAKISWDIFEGGYTGLAAVSGDLSFYGWPYDWLTRRWIPQPSVVSVDDAWSELPAYPQGGCADYLWDTDVDAPLIWYYDAFPTIQAGIDAVAESGTVNVAAGTYYETISVTKDDLTIQSLSGDPLDTVIDADGADGNVVTITDCSGVTLSGFTITGATGESQGIFMLGATGCTISNIVITEMGPLGHGGGILLKETSTGNSFNSVEISDIDGFQVHGVKITKGSNSNTFASTTISNLLGSKPGGKKAQAVGIFIQKTDNNEFVDTEITGIITPGGPMDVDRATGIHVTGSVGNTFTSTEVSGIQGGVARGIMLHQDIGTQGVVEFSEYHISDLTAKTSSRGIYLYESPNYTFSGGSLTGADIGFLVEASTGISIHNTNIAGNTEYGACSETETLDALYNYWGSANGPEHSGNTFNVGAQGGKVSDNVDYVPWLDAPYLGGASFAPVSSEDGLFSSIQAAIDAASSTTINVAAGTYEEDIKITKSNLTLKGIGDPPPVIDGGGGVAEVVYVHDATHVTIENFEVTGGTGDLVYGKDADNITIRSITAHGSTGDEGIQVKYSDNVTIEDCTSYKNMGDGICVGYGSGHLIKHNVIYDNDDRGIYLYGDWGGVPLSDARIEDNTVYGSWGTVPGGSDRFKEGGIICYYTQGIEIVGNFIYENIGPGIHLYKINYGRPEDVTSYVRDNHVHDNIDGDTPGDGIHAYLTYNTIISNNELDNNAGAGVTLTTQYPDGTEYMSEEPNSGVQVLANDIYRNTDGLQVISRLGDHGVHLNNIHTNTVGVEASQAADGVTVDATNNWWGTTTEAEIAGMVSGDVNFDPWLVIGISADPVSVEAGGTSTSTITADMTENSDGNDTSGSGHIPDGTKITFSTNKGSFSTLTTTTDGKATAILTSSTTVETATVTASAPPHTSAATATTAVFFTKSGVTVEDSKTETITDAGIDATDEADTEVIVDGSATVTAAKYSSNPGTGFSGDIGKYIDVHIDDPADVEIEIRLYYTNPEIAGRVESSLRLLWWNGTSWVACSDSGVNTTDVAEYSGYMWAKVRIDDTVPTLSQLSGTPFGGHGGTLPSPPPPPTVTLESIAASPSSLTLGVDETQQLTVTATYSDESTDNVTAEASYESSNASVTTVSDAGLITGVAEGSTTITVSYETKTDTVSVTVIAFTPWSYDADGDGAISKSEALTSVTDYFAGFITKAQALEVIALYFAS